MIPQMEMHQGINFAIRVKFKREFGTFLMVLKQHWVHLGFFDLLEPEYSLLK